MHPTLIIGQVYFVDNPAGKSYVGRITHIIDPFCVALEDASWIPDTGRYHLFCKGELDQNVEVEPCGVVACTRWQSIIKWPYPLPTEPR